MQLKTGRGIVLLLQFFAIASASILSGHPSSQPGLLLSDSHVSTRNGDNPIVASVLAKRFDLRFLRNRFAHTVNVGAGWIVYYNTFDVIHCISNIARNDLLRFYNLVLSLAGNDWANRAAQRTYTADFGDLTLVLSSTDPITWDFLHWFLVDMIMQIQAFQTYEFTAATFRFTFVNEVLAQTIVARLSLRTYHLAAAAAR